MQKNYRVLLALGLSLNLAPAFADPEPTPSPSESTSPSPSPSASIPVTTGPDRCCGYGYHVQACQTVGGVVLYTYDPSDLSKPAKTAFVDDPYWAGADLHGNFAASVWKTCNTNLTNFDIYGLDALWPNNYNCNGSSPQPFKIWSAQVDLGSIDGSSPTAEAECEERWRKHTY